MTSIFQAGQPFNLVRTSSTTYQASDKELVISSGDTVELPTPDQGATVLVRPAPSIDSVKITTSNGTIGNTGETYGYYRATEPLYLVGDGTNWYARSGSDEISAIPDSAIAQYDAQALSGNDGDGLSTWPDEIGNNDITGGNPIIRDAGINGNRSLEFDGVNDSLDISFSTISQPNTIISVVEFGKSDTTEDSFIIDSESNSDHAVSQGRFGEQSIQAGSRLGGTAVTQDPILITGIFDGSNSVIKENGSQQNTGDAGNNGLTGISVGINQSGSTDRMYQGYIGEIMVYESRLSSSEIDSEEQRLADKWGITL